MKMRLFLAVLALVTVAALTACQAAPSPAAPATNTVTMSGIKFHPSNLTVKVGTTVTWSNDDLMTHNVTSDTSLFTSGNMPRGATYSYTFTSAGTYPYACTIHPLMKGTITVQ